MKTKKEEGFVHQFTLKYRAKSFSEIFGQPGPIKEFLVKRKARKISQAYLIKGKYGTGKTSFAQLMAMSIQCLNPKENGDPCCECPSCKSIISESFDRDTVMLDGSTIGLKDDVIEFASMADSMPMYDPKKVFIIEETDQLSNGAKNALLKILEKPRKNVHFILLSMNNTGVPAPIQSRCQTFFFKPISTIDTMRALKSIMEKEGLWEDTSIPDTFKTEGLATISNVSQGSLRDAVQILERAISGNYYTLKELYENVGVLDEGTIAKVLLKILNGECAYAELENYEPLEIFQLGYTILTNANMYKATKYVKNEYFADQVRAIANHKNFEELIEAFRRIASKAKSFLRRSEVYDDIALFYRRVLTPVAGTQQIPTRVVGRKLV
jgi:DNA polymerase III subunit gamma/tau